MSKTWTVISTTQGDCFQNPSGDLTRGIAAQDYAVGTVARTCESTGLCFVYVCAEVLVDGVGYVRKWVRSGAEESAFCAGAPEFQPGATVTV